MSAQRARSAVTVDHRSVHPDIPGVPWWGAVLIAATFTAIGFAFDAGAGSRELSAVFAAAYVVGCLAAVLAVRQEGVFTAVIQPPLLLFVSVPTAYFLFGGAKITSIRDTLINCGYPLIERFPLMFFTSAAVLVIGIVRWYQGITARRASGRSTARSAAKESSDSSTGLAAVVRTKLSTLFSAADDEEAAEPPRRRRPQEPSRRPAKRTAPPRSRHTRPPETQIIEPVAERPRRTRSSRRTEPPPVPPAEPRRRPRPPSSGRRSGPPPTERRAGYDRPQRRRRYGDYPDYQPLEPHGRNGNGTHHPVSRVRYRGVDDSAERVEYRSRRRTPRSWEAENWEYDV